MNAVAAVVTPARLDVAVATEPGMRATNADAYLADEAAGLYAVSDGMGDTARSAAVARLALNAVRELFLEPWASLPPAERWAWKAAERLRLGVMQANGRLFVEGREAERRVGTTFAGAVICRDHLCVGSVGDSRAHIYRPRIGRLATVTTDDTVLNARVRHGEPYDVAAAQPMAHRLTRAIGLQRALELRPAALKWQPGDVLLVSTDGVTDWVDPEAIARTLGDANDLGAAAERLVHASIAAGGWDNATALLVRWVP